MNLLGFEGQSHNKVKYLSGGGLWRRAETSTTTLRVEVSSIIVWRFVRSLLFSIVGLRLICEGIKLSGYAFVMGCYLRHVNTHVQRNAVMDHCSWTDDRHSGTEPLGSRQNA